MRACSPLQTLDVVVHACSPSSSAARGGMRKLDKWIFLLFRNTPYLLFTGEQSSVLPKVEWLFNDKVMAWFLVPSVISVI